MFVSPSPSSSSSTASQSMPLLPNDILDGMLQKYEEGIEKEVRLINEISYPLSRYYSISTGLSPARGFLPVVMLRRNQNSASISFTNYEWDNIFLKHRKAIEEHMKTDPQVWCCGRCREESGDKDEVNHETIEELDLFTLKLCYVGGKVKPKEKMIPLIRVSRRCVEYTLDKIAITTLMRILNTVTKRLHRLVELDFPTYYDSLLRIIAQNPGDFEMGSIQQYVEKLVCGNQVYYVVACTGSNYPEVNSEYIDCVFEILNFELMKFTKDVSTYLNLN